MEHKLVVMMNKIKLSKDFSFAPGSRYPDEGDFSGQEFREKILLPKFKESREENRILEIDLDGTLGYGTSFLEEVFGGLAREFGIKVVLDNIKIISEEEEYLIDDITEYIKNAKD